MAQVKKSKTSKVAKTIVRKTAIKRKRKASKYQSFRLSKKISHPAGALPTSRIILIKSLKLMWSNKKVLLGIFGVYALLNLVLVRGFSAPLNIADVKETITDSFGGTISGTSMVGAIFGTLLGTSSTTESETAAVYQTMLFIVVSLALIWVFRQSAAGSKPTTKTAFYNGLYPLIPFLLVLLVLILQLIPAYVGSFVYGIVSSGGLAVTGLEQAIWLLFLGLLILLSVYMVCSSVFALYVVTLPDMHPMQALRSSRQLVFSRRLNVLRKMLLLPLIAFLVIVLIAVPAIYFLPVVAPWLYFLLTLATIIFLHAYLFTLYRELL